jgi:anaphase-promoting complex subunit 8
MVGPSHHPYGASNANDSSYSMLFSPAASSLASTPGGGMHGRDPMNRNSMNYTPNNNINNNNNNHNHNNSMNAMDYQQQQQQQQQQQELELNWDPTRVKSELLKASAVLSHRCLKLAGKWAAEQVVGIPVGTAHPVVVANGGGRSSDSNNFKNNDNNNDNVNIEDADADADVDLSFNTNDCILDQQDEEDSNLSMLRELSGMSADDWYAKSLFDLGEFLHAASVLSASASSASGNSNDNNSNTRTAGRRDITQMGPPKSDLSSFGFYLRAYALYMAGERRKEEEYSELEGNSSSLGGGSGANSGSGGGNSGNPNEGGSGKAAGGVSLSAASARVKNPYLSQLVREVSEAYQDDAFAAENNNNNNNNNGGDEKNNNDNNNNNNYKLDAFGLYVYGMLLKEAKKESIPCPHPPHMILVESLLEFPFNWSAWLDLCDVLVGGTGTNHHEDLQQNAANSGGSGSGSRNHHAGAASTNIEQQVEQALQSTLATHYMYHFFCAHLMAHHHGAHEDALVLLERLYEPLPDQPLFQSPHVKTQLAVVFYYLRELEQALMWFRETAEDDKYSLDHKDVYSNILYVKEDRVGLSHLAHESVVIDKYRPETCCIVGNYYSLKQQRHKAVLYFQRALKLDRSYTSAWTLMGHEYVELKQTEQAMESYRRAVTVSPKDYRAWYGLGQTYEFLNMYLYALFYYRKAATLRPYDPRMWCAVGQCFSALHKIPDAIRAYERAVSQEDNEGIATQKLAALYRQGGKKEEAAQCYLRHLELRYLVTSASPEHHQQQAQAQHQQQAAPTLDAIVQGIVLESVEAEALLFLAQYYKSHGEFDTAALLCSRLVEYPGPEKEQAKGLLRDLRSRGRRYPSRASPGGRPSMSPRVGTPGGASDSHPGGGTHSSSPFQFSP